MTSSVQVTVLNLGSEILQGRTPTPSVEYI